MEKHAHAKSTSKNRVLKLLPKVMTSAFTFQSPPPFSPGKDRRTASSPSLSAGGPLVSLVPVDCRRKKTNGGGGGGSGGGLDSPEEPTSPKVSCMGQVKHSSKNNYGNNNNNNNANKDRHDNMVHRSSSSMAKGDDPVTPRNSCNKVKPHHFSTIRRVFGSAGKDSGRMSSSSADQAIMGRPPALRQMKRFASGRDAFANFDWTAQVAPVEPGYRNMHSGQKTSSEKDEIKDEQEQDIRRDLRLLFETNVT